MTIRDYIQQKLNISGLQLPTELIDVEISKQSLVPTDALAKVEHPHAVDLVIYHLIPTLLLAPTSVSEGGFSTSYNYEGLRSYYASLCRQLGKPNLLADSVPTVKDITNRW